MAVKVLLYPVTGVAWQSNWIALSLSLIVLIILISRQLKSAGSDSELWTCAITTAVTTQYMIYVLIIWNLLEGT